MKKGKVYNHGMANKQAQKRKTYSLSNERSLDLAKISLQMTEETGKTVPRQSILDTLVSLLQEKDVYDRVVNSLQSS